MKTSTTIFFILTCAILSNCASQQVLQSSNRNQPREINARAIECFVDGVIYDLKEDYASALIAYQEALLYDSTASEIYLAIGKDYLRLGKGESAIRILSKCLDINPTETEAQEIMSTLYITQKKWGPAEEMLRQMLDLDSTRWELYYDLAYIYTQNNEIDKVIKTYRRILSLQETPDPQVYLNLGDIYLDLNRIEDAAEIYRQFIQSESDGIYESLGYYGLGFTSEILKDTTTAIENYSRALELSPEMNQARDHLIQLFIAQKKWESALDFCREAIDRDSTELNNWLDITYIYQQRGDTALASQTLNKAKNLFPDNWRVYSYSGHFFLENQEFDLALQEFKRVTELAPEIASGWLYSGISLVYLDSLDHSQYYFEKVLNSEPDDPMANYYMGSTMGQLGRNNEAIPYLEKALEINQDWISVISTLAGIYDQLKNYEKSDSLFDKALHLDPDNALINNNYGYSLSERGIRLNEAMEMAQKALEQDPENGAFLDTMGWIYYKIGDYEKALEYIRKAYSVRQESAILVDHLGDVYDKLEMKKEARKAWEEALKLDQDNPNILEKLNRITEE